MNDETHQPTIQDTWVDSPDGRLFARGWTPAASSALAPIVLLHDSLGSVELWRSFPAALCEATGRRVIAYDRLGFGRSDPHPDTLALDFIASEAEAGFAAVRRHFGLERFVVFGHSVGGGMAVNLAAHLGEACVALITECSMADNVALESPNTEFVRPCNLCPHMKRITLEGIRQSLETMTHQVEIPADIAVRARRAVERMLEIGRNE